MHVIRFMSNVLLKTPIFTIHNAGVICGYVASIHKQSQIMLHIECFIMLCYFYLNNKTKQMYSTFVHCYCACSPNGLSQYCYLLLDRICLHLFILPLFCCRQIWAAIIIIIFTCPVRLFKACASE